MAATSLCQMINMAMRVVPAPSRRHCCIFSPVLEERVAELESKLLKVKTYLPSFCLGVQGTLCQLMMSTLSLRIV